MEGCRTERGGGHTRGFGLLEGLLSDMRAARARRLLEHAPRRGRILDLGCGPSPNFLRTVDFTERHGLDISAPAQGSAEDGIMLARQDLAASPDLPYPDGFFDAVTMLAVLEHIAPAHLPALMLEVHRVLAPEGIFVLTTPAAWSDALLRGLAHLRLVSRIEIEDHKAVYDRGKLLGCLEGAGFGRAAVRLGYFQFRLNIWVQAVKG